jgi:hypothetical protein
VLDELGLEYKRENNEYKLRITRKRRSPELGGMAQQNRRKSSYTNATPFKSLLRRPSATPTPSPPPATAVPSVIYGDPLVDSGDEVRFSVEICRIKNLPGLYIVDMRRLRGNVWAYKFLYRSLMKKLELGGREKYLNNK